MEIKKFEVKHDTQWAYEFTHAPTLDMFQEIEHFLKYCEDQNLFVPEHKANWSLRDGAQTPRTINVLKQFDSLSELREKLENEVFPHILEQSKIGCTKSEDNNNDPEKFSKGYKDFSGYYFNIVESWFDIILPGAYEPFSYDPCDFTGYYWIACTEEQPAIILKDPAVGKRYLNTLYNTLTVTPFLSIDPFESGVLILPGHYERMMHVQRDDRPGVVLRFNFNLERNDEQNGESTS